MVIINNVLIEDISLKGIYLEKYLGIKDIAWTFESVIKIMEVAFEKNYIVLGGDIFECSNNTVNFTYDSWYINAEDYLSDYKGAKERAVEYIKQYNVSDDKNKLLYSVVIKEKI